MQQEEQTSWAMRVLEWGGYFFVLAGVAAQLLLIHLLSAHRYAAPGESRAWEGMGLMMMIFMSLFVVIPGTLIAIYRTIKFVVKYRSEGDGAVSAILNLGVALLPLVVYQVLMWSDTKPSPPTGYRNPIQMMYDKRPQELPVTPQSEKLAGAVFAIDHGIETVSECSQGSADFIAGCVEQVKRLPKSDTNKRPPESPATRQSKKVAGAMFAMDNGIESVSGCTQGTADFIAGCIEQVKRQPKRKAD